LKATHAIFAHNFTLSALLLITKFHGAENIGTKSRPARSSGQTSRAQSRQRGGYAMWTALFTITAVIAVALSLAAIAIDSANGGKFRL
jgi:hypothetical protein